MLHDGRLSKCALAPALRVVSEKMAPTQNSVYLFRKSVPHRFAPTGTPLVISVVLHSSFALLLFNLPQIFSARTDLRFTPALHSKIYYFVPVVDTSRTLPHILRSPVTSPPSNSSQPQQRSAWNSQDTQGNLAIISRPRQPDNMHQTILQSAAPDIRIPVDLPLPDVVMQQKQGDSPTIPVDLANAKPIEQRKRLVDAAVPSIAPSSSPSLQPSLAAPTPAQVPAPPISIATPTLARPRIESVALPTIAAPSIGTASAPNAPAQVPLPIPSVSVAKPVQTRRSSLDPISAPAIQAPSTPNIPSPNVAASHPQLPFPSFSVANLAPVTRTAGVPEVAPSPTNQADLVIVGVNPSPPVSQIILPPGTRVGDFAVAPPSPSPISSQRGESNTAKNAEVSQPNLKSISGSTRGDKTTADTLLISDPASDKPETSGALGPALPPDAIFPVHWDSPLRKRRTIVATGSIGGGGLGVYGVLNCPKIYTVFLPMPRRNWTMEYCDTSPAPKPASAASGSLAIEWGDAILPPEPASKFDFHRLPVPLEKRNKMIVLKGILQPDGSVTELQVYRGVTPQMNEAAKLAFSRWKFKPAIRHGVPVPVQLLIGIPAAVN